MNIGIGGMGGLRLHIGKEHRRLGIGTIGYDDDCSRQR